MKPLTVRQYGHVYAPTTARLTFKSGKEVYLCNSHDDIREAMQGGIFDAHEVRGNKPHDVTVNPAHVALVEYLKYEEN